MKKIIMYCKENFYKTLKDEEGMGVVEVILIVLVLVGLALIFKNQIITIANGIFNSIKTQVSQF